MKSKTIRGTTVPLAPSKDTTPTKHDKREPTRHEQNQSAQPTRKGSPLFICVAIILIALAYISGLHYTRSLASAHTAAIAISSIDAATASIESDLITAALYHTTQFNPEKRTAFHRALNAPETGYEARVLMQWQKNLTDTESAATVRNDFMTGYMTARPEAAPKQETIANLLDAMDAQLHDKAEQMLALDTATRRATCWLRTSTICALLGAIMLILGLRHL